MCVYIYIYIHIMKGFVTRLAETRLAQHIFTYIKPP